MLVQHLRRGHAQGRARLHSSLSAAREHSPSEPSPSGRCRGSARERRQREPRSSGREAGPDHLGEHVLVAKADVDLRPAREHGIGDAERLGPRRTPHAVVVPSSSGSIGAARAWYQSPTRSGRSPPGDEPSRETIAKPDDDRQQERQPPERSPVVQTRATRQPTAHGSALTTAAAEPTAPLHGHPRPAAQAAVRAGRRGSSDDAAAAAEAPGGGGAPLLVGPNRGPSRRRVSGSGGGLLLLRLRSLNHRLLLRWWWRRCGTSSIAGGGGGGGGGGTSSTTSPRPRAAGVGSSTGCTQGLDRLPPGEVLDERDEDPTESHHENDQRRAQVREADHDREQDQEPASSTNLGPTAAGIRLED